MTAAMIEGKASGGLTKKSSYGAPKTSPYLDDFSASCAINLIGNGIASEIVTTADPGLNAKKENPGNEQNECRHG
ncbi:hypothetical protein, partial [Mesorhizobium sp. M2A.F.Ca.ET.067.02.1.1]|uniref:hypothetical protein n=1 Tax=Mesorhizobium sp. M2A.F.Ca.ET.067.02.1.1 TaxID=2496749 RepID=UPI000FD48DED